MIRNIVVCLALSCLGLTHIHAKDRMQLQAEGRVIIERAIKVSDLRDPSVGPFVLKATRLATKDSPETKYVFYWSAPNYREEVTQNDRTEVRVGNATTEWRQHRTYFTGSVFHVTKNVFDLAHLRSQLSSPITDVRLTKIKDVQLQCVTLAEDSGTREMCFDPHSGALLRATSNQSFDLGCPPRRRPCTSTPTVNVVGVTFRAKWAEFRGMLFAREYRHQSSGLPAEEWHLDSLQSLTSASPELFNPELGSEAWAYCESYVSPTTTSRGIDISDTGKLAAIREVRVQLIINPEGKATEGFVISERKPGDGAKVIEYFEKQQYKAARCGDTPVQGELVFTWHGAM